jgi:hypothetical protein
VADDDDAIDAVALQELGGVSRVLERVAGAVFGPADGDVVFVDKRVAHEGTFARI